VVQHMINALTLSPHSPTLLPPTKARTWGSSIASFTKRFSTSLVCHTFEMLAPYITGWRALSSIHSGPLAPSGECRVGDSQAEGIK